MFCVPVLAKNTEEVLEMMTEAAPMADIMEVRLDLMESFELGTIIRAAAKPLLVTYRSDREGGRGKIDPDAVAGSLITALQEGAELIDVELSMERKYRERIFNFRGKSRIIVSTHINDCTPSRQALEKIFEESVSAGGDIVKIVTMAQRWDDNFRVLELIPEARDKGIDIIAFCMGPLGRISRIFSLLMGAHMTFVSLEKGLESASGQIPITEMKRILEFFTP